MDPLNKMLTQSAVLSRPGWSKSLLVKLLGEPDQRKKQRGRSNLMCLYSEERVTFAETQDVFFAAQEAMDRRKQAAQKSAEVKRDQLMEVIEKIQVQVRRIDPAQLEDRVIVDYNKQNWDSPRAATAQSDRSFLDRLCVNFIRYECVKYNFARASIKGRTWASEAEDVINEKIFEAIAKVYPEYRVESKRQKEELFNENRMRLAGEMDRPTHY